MQVQRGLSLRRQRASARAAVPPTTATAATESGGAHFTMSGSRQFHKGVRIKSIAQGKAGKCKVQAGRNKANRGNSSVARAVKR